MNKNEGITKQQDERKGKKRKRQGGQGQKKRMNKSCLEMFSTLTKCSENAVSCRAEFVSLTIPKWLIDIVRGVWSVKYAIHYEIQGKAQDSNTCL